MAEIRGVEVGWWNGYRTVMVEPTSTEVARVRDLKQWVQENKPLFYVPLPFPDFLDTPPLRHYPHERWALSVASLYRTHDLPEGWSFLDVGCNVGYYAFLAACVGARACGIDADPKAIYVMREAAIAYDMRVEAHEGLIEEFDGWDVDVAFAFSVLPYLGRNDPERLKSHLRMMAQRVGVSFVEMGDGGSDLPWCRGDAAFEALFRECGFTAVTSLGPVFSSHTNTQRTLWRCDGAR